MVYLKVLFEEIYLIIGRLPDFILNKPMGLFPIIYGILRYEKFKKNAQFRKLFFRNFVREQEYPAWIDEAAMQNQWFAVASLSQKY